MRLIIDGQPLQNANSRDSGIGRYTSNFLSSLAQLPENHEIILALRSDLLPWNNSHTKIKTLFYTPPTINPSNLDADHMRCEHQYAKWISQHSPDVYINTDNMNPWFLVPRFGIIKPITASIYYDLIPLLFPDIYLYDINAVNFHAIRLRSLLKNDLIFSISEQSSKDLAHFFPEAKDKLLTIYGAMDPCFSHESKPETNSTWIDLQSKLNLDKPYFFHVGRWEPRKNLEGAIEGFACFNLKYPNQYNLVINCTLKPDQFISLNTLASQFNVQHQLRITGRTNDHELKLLYKNARLLFFPSFYEGLGLPILESLASGTPVAVSRTSSMPEFAGPDAGLFDPSNPQDMATCLEKMLAIPKESLSESGKAFANSFSWAKITAKSIDAIESLIANPKKPLRISSLVRLWPILSENDTQLTVNLISQLKLEFSVRHFISTAEKFFPQDLINLAPIQSWDDLGLSLLEDPSQVLICWPRSAAELALFKAIDFSEKYLILDEVNRNFFCSGSSFETRNKTADNFVFNGFKGVMEMNNRNEIIFIHLNQY